MSEQKKEKQRVLSGVQPSGSMVHLGNYLGAMQRFVTLSREYDSFFCLVDLHALTSVSEAKHLRDNTTALAAAYLAIGLDPGSTVLFRQSDVAEVCELAWYLACQFPLGLLERAHKLKDSKAKGVLINSGTMFYPILMAADILLYHGTLVPVGIDQKQHVEMCRDVAQKFNQQYEREVFSIPAPLIEESLASLPGTDGRKMSKSYDNFIGLFETEKNLRQKIMRIVTDSKTVEEKKDPEQCNVFALYKVLASAEEVAELRERYLAGGMGYGHAKEELYKVASRLIAPLRERYETLLNKPDYLRDVLRDGAKRAKKVAQSTLLEVREVIGLGPTLV